MLGAPPGFCQAELLGFCTWMRYASARPSSQSALLMSRWNFSRTTTQIHWIMASLTCWFTWSKPTFAQRREHNDPTNISKEPALKGVQISLNCTPIPHPKSDRLPL